jgi:hypothetical protein
VPEGYAFYALYPETFLEAAGQFARTSSPGTAVCIRLLGDRFLPERLPFYRITYLASRLGYASFSTGALKDSGDGERMRRELERYRAKLCASLGGC